jgi:hypothetical protein
MIRVFNSNTASHISQPRATQRAKEIRWDGRKRAYPEALSMRSKHHLIPEAAWGPGTWDGLVACGLW